MASVDFKKMKTSTEVKRTIRHCDKEKRKEDNHSNKQINKDLTSRNVTLFKNNNYETVCKIYDEKMDYLNKQPNANKRSDKVTCFGLEIPLPKDLADKDNATKGKWFSAVANIVANQYGVDNILNGYLHKDEIHDYKNAETGEDDTSREHLHMFVMPVIDNRLNGRDFSSKKNIITLNNSIQEMSKEQFNVEFMTGSKKKSTKTVEQLKSESRLQEVYSDIQRKQQANEYHSNVLATRESDLNALEDDLNTRQLKLQEKEQNVLQREIDVKKQYSQLEDEKINYKQGLQKQFDDETEAYKEKLQKQAKAHVTDYCNNIADERKRIARRNAQRTPDVSDIMQQADSYSLDL